MMYRAWWFYRTGGGVTQQASVLFRIWCGVDKFIEQRVAVVVVVVRCGKAEKKRSFFC